MMGISSDCVRRKNTGKYAQEEFKPSVKKSLEEQGTPIDEMLRSEDTGGMDWIPDDIPKYDRLFRISEVSAGT